MTNKEHADKEVREFNEKFKVGELVEYRPMPSTGDSLKDLFYFHFASSTSCNPTLLRIACKASDVVYVPVVWLEGTTGAVHIQTCSKVKFSQAAEVGIP